MLNVEIMHLYADDLSEQSVIEAARNSRDFFIPSTAQRDGLTVCALVDDYNATLERSRAEVASDMIWIAIGEGIWLDWVAFEADCERESGLLLDEAGVSEGEQRHFLRETSGSITSVLVKDGSYTACPALAAVWSLARLGIEPFNGSIDLYAREGMTAHFSPADTLLTVLPTKYIRTEATVYDLLRASPYEVRGKISYVFY